MILRLHDGRAILWEQLLPEEIHLLPGDLAAVDRLLDDPRLLAPFVARFDCPIGRPTIPIDSYLRLIYLTATASATRRWSARWPTLCRGGSSVASAWTSAHPTRPP